MLTTLEDTYALVTSHLQRVRDLTEQAANGTYGQDSLDAIKAEITSRLDEIDRISANCEFNGKHLMDASITANVNLQVGIKGAATLVGEAKATVATKCAGTATAASMLTKLDAAIKKVSTNVTNIGAAQNRIESAIESIGVQSENITSSLSTIKDADVAKESSEYIKSQILQQAAATLLSTANQSPSIALNLI